MTTSRRCLVFVFTMVLSGIFATGCDDIVADPNFHTWCGDELCSWKLESGAIRRAPTWHPKDYGVELLDSNDASRTTAISQRVDKTPKCLEFTTVADVAVAAQVTIGVDFNSDGTIEYEQPIAATGFREQKTQVTAPPAYSNIRFVITKKGTGRAVLAQMDVRSKDVADCTAEPVALSPQVQGTTCSILGHGAECKSGICCEGLCAECCAAGSRNASDAGGGSSVPTGACSDGAKCASLPLVGYRPLASGFLGIGGDSIPRQCDPGTRTRPAGSECLLDQDCTSGACDGAIWDVQSTVDGGGACPPPPAQGKDCNVSSVRAGVCR